jgi:hypothetical protein
VAGAAEKVKKNRPRVRAVGKLFGGAVFDDKSMIKNVVNAYILRFVAQFGDHKNVAAGTAVYQARYADIDGVLPDVIKKSAVHRHNLSVGQIFRKTAADMVGSARADNDCVGRDVIRCTRRLFGRIDGHCAFWNKALGLEPLGYGIFIDSERGKYGG